MAVTLPYPTLTGTIVSSELDSNFSTLANRFGNIVNADIASGAAIDIDKLSAQYERMHVRFSVHKNDGTTDTVGGIAVSNLGAVTANTRLDVIPIPGDSSDTNWQISDVSWFCTDTGSGDAQVSILWGYLDATGTWVTSSTPVAAFIITNAAATNDANDAHQVNGANTAIDFNHATGGNTPRSLALNLAVVGTNDATNGALSTAGSRLVVSVLLRRKIQAS